MEKYKNVILGAGIAGLAAANELDRAETAVFEARDRLGGLCSSFMIDDFSFDTAVHLSFTEKPEARALFDQTPYLKHQPTAYNFYKNYWIKHPVLNNLFKFSTEEKIRFIKDFAQRDAKRDIKTYEDWLLASYGSSICEEFYNVYTEKYWTVKPEKLSINWINGRLNDPDWDKLLRGAFEKNTGNDYYASEMRYPESGKYETFLKPLIKNVNIQTNKKVTEINSSKKLIIFSDGTSCIYENLISTIPLPELIKVMGNAVPQDVRSAAKNLIATSVSIVSVGFKKPDIQPYLWFYIYDKDIMAARAYSPSIKSPKNAPDGCSSLQFEIYHNPQEKIPSEKEMLENTRYALNKTRICSSADDILFMDCRFIPYANVIFYIGMENDRQIIRDFLKRESIIAAGRFGEWDYLWSDQSYLSGKTSVKNLKK